jgi:prevent-host-death family protein
MPRTYSLYEAKTHLSDILKRVRGGERVRISYRGEEVAEIRPLRGKKESFEERRRRLEAEGILQPAAASPRNPWPKPLAKRPGALTRFLEARD